MGKAKGRHKVEHLTAAFCKTAKEGRHADGRGLYLVVSSSGTKRWMQRITIGGDRKDIALGIYPAVSLADARTKALANKGQVIDGIDPVAAKEAAEAAKAAAAKAEADAKRAAEQAAKAAAAVPTFSKAVDDYLSFKLAEFRNEKHKAQWRSTLDTYAGPIIGKKPVDQITVADVLRVLQPIWTTKTVTATRLRQRLEAVLQSATVAGHRTGENPAQWRNTLSHLLPKPSKVATHENQPAVSLSDAPEWFADLRQRDGMGAKALEFAALTGSRSGEVRGAMWNEFDLENGVWTVPASRMKAKRQHRVALSKEAVQLLEALPKLDKSPLVFPASRGGVLSDMTLSATMRRMHQEKLANDQKKAGKPLSDDEGGWRDPVSRRPAVPHGLRSTFRQWAAERGYPREVSEMALAHFVGSEVERAYQRSDMLERRRAMMQAWASFLHGSEGENVVQLVARA